MQVSRHAGILVAYKSDLPVEEEQTGEANMAVVLGRLEGAEVKVCTQCVQVCRYAGIHSVCRYLDTRERLEGSRGEEGRVYVTEEKGREGGGRESVCHGRRPVGTGDLVVENTQNPSRNIACTEGEP